MTADTQRAWEIVLRSIEAALLSGELRPGDHLPPERALAAELGVGRSSVREAVRVLEVLGLIRTATGSGPTSGAIIVATPSGGMSALMRLQVAAQGFAVADVVKTRLLLETSIAAELASAVTAPAIFVDPVDPLDPLASATQLLDAMDSPTLTETEFLALDAQFHVALAEASGNQVVAAMMAGLRNSIESYVVAAVPNLTSWPATSARLRGEHHGIVEAIYAGDPADAALRMRAHITGYYAESRLTPLTPAPSPTPTPTPTPSPAAPTPRPARARKAAESATQTATLRARAGQDAARSQLTATQTAQQTATQKETHHG